MVSSTDYAKQPKAGARARVQGSHGAMQSGSMADDQQKGEGLGLAGAHRIRLRERKATERRSRRVRGSASGITTSREVSWFFSLERGGKGIHGGCLKV